MEKPIEFSENIDIAGQDQSKSEALSDVSDNPYQLQALEYDHRMELSAWEAPYPPPHVFEGFDRVLNNGAERLFELTLNEQQNRFENDRTDRENMTTIVKGNEFRLNIGQCTASFIAILVVTTSMYMFTQKRYTEGSVLAGIIAASAVVVRAIRASDAEPESAESNQKR